MNLVSKILVSASFIAAATAQAKYFELDSVVSLTLGSTWVASESQYCHFESRLVEKNNVHTLEVRNSTCSLISIKGLEGTKMFKQDDGSFKYSLETPEKYTPVAIVSQKDRGAEIRFGAPAPKAVSVTLAEGQTKFLKMCGDTGAATYEHGTLKLYNADQCTEIQRIAGESNESAWVPFSFAIELAAFPEDVIILRDANHQVRARITIVGE